MQSDLEAPMEVAENLQELVEEEEEEKYGKILKKFGLTTQLKKISFLMKMSIK